MRLEHFTDSDIQKAAELTFFTWGSELPQEKEFLKAFIYEAMVRYYFKNQRFSYKITENNLLQAFLLAGKIDDHEIFSDWLIKEKKKFNTHDCRIVDEYLAYLSYNSQIMDKYASDNDLMLLLFLSRLPGAGGRLLHNIEQQAVKAGLERIFLWADATCDYDYYYKKGFQEVLTFVNNKMSELGQQQTIIFCKKLSKKPNN